MSQGKRLIFLSTTASRMNYDKDQPQELDQNDHKDSTYYLEKWDSDEESQDPREMLTPPSDQVF